MKEKILQVAAAILLGLLMPGLVIRLTKGAGEERTEPAASSSAVSQTQPSSQAAGIWVLTDSAGTQWMALDAYLTGVLLAEMPTSYDLDALCAQAVAARTYALKRQTEARHDKGAVCADPACCQAYISVAEYLDGWGYEADVAVAQSAVQTTSGMVLTYEDDLIEATYFHCSGGLTEEDVAVWGVDYPYLQVVESPGEEEMDHYSERVFFSRAELASRLERTLAGTPASWIGWMTYTPGGGVETFLFAGIQYSGIQMRSLLELNSTVFSVEAEGDGLWFTTLGKGHRVGMSQTGAQAMALGGSTWQEILAHYYPGTRIDKMEDVG